MKRPNEEFGGWFWTNLRIYTPWKAIATLTATATFVVGCGREGGVARTLAPLEYFTHDHPANGPRSAPEQLTDAAEDMRKALNRGSEDGAADLSDGATIRRARTRLDQMIVKTRAELAHNRPKLQNLGATDAVGRLDAIVAVLDKSQRALDDAFSVPSAANSLRTINTALNDIAPQRESRNLSAGLAFGSVEANPRRASLSAGVTPAYSSPTPGEQSAMLPRAPSQEDLANSGETTVTASVRALAESLDHDPVRIYQYVRNKIKFEPYYGVRKGAAQTLLEQSGSDADQAALLVALLRASSLPARFVRGTVEAPLAQTANWLGIDPAKGQTIAAAPDVLASSGRPTTAVRVDGDLTKVRFEHFWVESYVPTGAYRGVEEHLGASRWLPLDPSVKSLRFTAATANTPLISTQERAAVQAAFDSSARTQSDGLVFDNFDALRKTTADVVQSKIASVPRAVKKSGELAAYYSGGSAIRAVEASYLPSSLPFWTRAVIAEYRQVPAALSASVSVSINGANPMMVPGEDADPSGAVDYSASTSSLASKRVTITYAPASSGDAEIIDAYHGLLNTPAYAASLVPVLRVDGRVVAHGATPAAPGYLQHLRITYREPGFTPQVTDNALTVGGITALVLDVGSKTSDEVGSQIDTLRRVLDSSTEEQALTDSRIGAMLQLAGDTYFQGNDVSNAVLARGAVDARRALSGALVATNLRTSVIGGFPVGVRLAGTQIDVDADNQTVVSLRTGGDAVSDYISASGSAASQAEASSLDLVFGGTNGISTTRILAAAAEQGIPLYGVRASNADLLLPELQLDPDTLSGVKRAIAEGDEVLVPGRAVTIGDWSGNGYVVNGDGRREFMISGSLSGGFHSDDPVAIYIHLLACAALGVYAIAEIIGLAVGIGAAAVAAAAFFGIAIPALLLFAPILLGILGILFCLYLMFSREAKDEVEDDLGEAPGVLPVGSYLLYLKKCTR